MPRPRASRRNLLVAATIYAAATYAAVELLHAWEIDHADLGDDGSRPWRLVHETLWIHFASFSLWLGLALATALLAHRSLERLRRARQNAANLERAQHAFIAYVAHEFRTPLTGITGFSELIRDYDLTPAEIKEYAAGINADAERLASMIADFLALDRLRSGQSSLTLLRRDLNALVSEIVAGEEGVSRRPTIQLDLDPTLGAVLADRDQLTRAMTTILRFFTAETDPEETVDVGTRVVAAGALVIFSTRRPILDRDSLERLFDPFANRDDDPTSASTGRGLQLALARQVIVIHHGRLDVEAMEGGGVEVVVALPQFVE